jgi:hypothetical protein
VPVLDDRMFLVTDADPRLLAIASSPAEAAPPAAVSLTSLYVNANGPRSAGLSWAFCVARKALTDEGTVSPDCLASSGPDLVPLGTGPSVTGALPMNGCQLFGPDPPTAVDGQPAGRPVDPDPTGGFYQPAALLVHDAVSGVAHDTGSIGSTRIACGLGGATPDVLVEFNQRYRMNENPALASLSLVRASGITTVAPDTPGAAPGATATAGESLTLHATWATCPTTPVCGDGVCGIDETIAECPADCTHPLGCSGAEQYLLFDPETQALEVHQEAITVAWFATGGTLADDSSGRAESEAGTPSLDNGWTVPAQTGEVRLWLVVRDDRGGVGWQSYRVQVE